MVQDLHNSSSGAATATKRAEYPARDVVDNRIENSSPAMDDNYVELKYRSTRNYSTAALARGIGIFSIALGLAEVLMPNRLGELAGVSRSHRKFLPALGLREIAHGVGILRSAKPTTAVWSRVGGDALDLAFLGASFASDQGNKARLTGATAAVLGVTALDVICAQQLSDQNWRESTNPKAPTTLGQPSGRAAFVA